MAVASMPSVRKSASGLDARKALMNLYEFDVEPFNDVGDYTDWDLRHDLDNQTTLLFEHSKLH